MISLIAVDMDGTLLNADGNIPEHFWEVFERLDSKDIRFCVASGRQYNNLKLRFQDISDRIIFISDNGTYVVYKGKPLYSNSIPLKHVLELAQVGRNIPDATMVACATSTAYMERSSSPVGDAVLAEVAKYYVTVEMVDSFADVKDDILKFAVCTFKGSEEFALPSFLPFADRFAVVVSGKYWMDIMPPDANKGVALAHVQRYFGVPRENTMAFGDFLNDVELLQNAKYSFAMANSHPDLFQHANYTAAANFEDGVLRQINHMLNHPEEYEDEFDPSDEQENE